MHTETEQLSRITSKGFEAFHHPHKSPAEAKLEDFEAAFEPIVRTARELEQKGVAYKEIEALLLPSLRHTAYKLEAWLNTLPPETTNELGKQFRERFGKELREGVFSGRALDKPLGYAGDYMMVALIWANEPGGTVFGKLLDRYYLSLHAAVAHRNRILMLEEYLQQAVDAARAAGHTCRVLNVGCGPAIEVCNFIRHNPGISDLELTLMDFNQETLDFARRQIEEVKEKTGSKIKTSFVLRSVMDVIRDRADCLLGGGFDLVYCAGLYDYLKDRVCTGLNECYLNSVRPGGRVVVTNVLSDCYGLTLGVVLADWPLITRSREDMSRLVPSGVNSENVEIRPDPSQGNVFLVLKK